MSISNTDDSKICTPARVHCIYFMIDLEHVLLLFLIFTNVLTCFSV